MISLSTKPKKRWYSYADDGHICEITCNTPSDKGGGTSIATLDVTLIRN